MPAFLKHIIRKKHNVFKEIFGGWDQPNVIDFLKFTDVQHIQNNIASLNDWSNTGSHQTITKYYKLLKLTNLN